MNRHWSQDFVLLAGVFAACVGSFEVGAGRANYASITAIAVGALAVLAALLPSRRRR